MYNELFKSVIEQAPALPATLVKANKLAAANLEKLSAWQIESLKSYVNLGLDRLKAAVEVTDPKSLQGFYNDQLEAAKIVREKLADDSQALGKLSGEFKADFEKLVQENIAEISPKANKTGGRKTA